MERFTRRERCESTEAIFSKIGLSTAEAIRLFLKQVELHRGLPFPAVTPNEETIAAMREANSGNGLRRYRSFRELRGNRKLKAGS